jgi:hypothetical protein
MVDSFLPWCKMLTSQQGRDNRYGVEPLLCESTSTFEYNLKMLQQWSYHLRDSIFTSLSPVNDRACRISLE